MIHYKSNYTEFAIKYSYKILYIISKCQIYYNQILKNIRNNDLFKKYSKTIPSLYKSTESASYDSAVEQIKIKQAFKIIKNDQTKIITNVKDVGFYIYSDNKCIYEKDEDCAHCVNRVIFQSYPIDFHYEISNVSFISIEVIIDTVFFKIQLKTDKYNYYIVDNVFDRNFFVYYLVNNYDNFKLEETDMETMKVRIIDSEAEIKDVDIVRNLIKLGKDKYFIESSQKHR